MLEESLEDKRLDQRLWDASLMFLEGRQWLNYDKRVDQYVAASVSTSVGYKVTVNLLLNVYRNVLARLALAYPSVVVLPASPMYDDIIKAQSSETALKYFWQSQRVKDTLTQGIEWLLTTGTVALHTYYDPTDKNCKLSVAGAYDIFFEKGVRSPDESRWVAIRTYHTRSSLKEAYPDKAEIIDSTVGISSDDSTSGATPLDHPGSVADRIEIYEIYWRDGRHVISTGSQYLYTEEYPVDCFPIQIIRFTSIPRRCWGLSLLAPLLDLQLLYNKARSQLSHNIDLMGSPKWLVPKTSGISTGAITNRPGEKIYYNPAGGAPQQIAPAPIPSYVIDNMARIQSEMGDVAGLHSVSLGKRAVGVTSGKAMETLSAYDTSQLQGTQLAIESAVAVMAKCVLQIMQKYYTEEKMMRMLDEIGRVTFHALKGTDLSDSPEVFIEAGSLFRDEAQDRDAKVLELLQLGLLPPEQALDELSFRTGNSFVSERVRGLAHARDMLEAAKRGGEIELFRSDDLAAFAEVFNEYIQGSEFYTLADEDQDYIRDILVAINAANAPDDQYIQMLQTQQVFPRPVPPQQDAAGLLNMVGAMNTGSGQTQQMEEMAAKQQQVGSIGSAERMLTNRAEALLANRGGL